jgi:hypothetical protein
VIIHLRRFAPDPRKFEVLSESNTEAVRKRWMEEYFTAGVRLVWYLDPEPLTVGVYTSLTEVHLLTEEDTLDGGEVLPGFQLPVRERFERAEHGRGRDGRGQAAAKGTALLWGCGPITTSSSLSVSARESRGIDLIGALSERI